MTWPPDPQCPAQESEATCGATHDLINGGEACYYKVGHLNANLPHTTPSGFWWF